MGHPLTTQVASIAACLPEQFIRIGAFDSPRRISSSRTSSSSGQPGGVWRASSVSPADGEDAAYPLDVEGLAGVRRTRQREQLALERQARLEHGQRLDRLVARSRQHRTVDIAGRGEHRAVAVEHDPRPVVVALDEPGPHDLGDDDGGGR